MVKRLLLAVLVCSSLAASPLSDKIVHLIGYQKYSQNRAILNAIFIHIEKFKTPDGKIDTLKVIRVLKRLGFVKLHYPSKVPQKIRFATFGDPHAFYKLVFDALANAAVFNYAIDSIVKDEEGSAITVSFSSSFAPDPARIVALFQDAGLDVSDVRRSGRDWSYFIGGGAVRLRVPRVQGSVELVGLARSHWVEAMGSVKIISHSGNHWTPAVYIYDAYLRPIKSIVLYTRRRSLAVSLPKGRYYIKIADRFSKHNIRNGFTVSSQ